MKYRIDTAYCWYNKGTQIVLMYFINGIPFTFDDLPHTALHMGEMVEAASQSLAYEPEDLCKSSCYLIDELCHPMLFDVELENPELLPAD